MPNPFAASWTVLSCKEPVVGSHRTPTPESVGTHSMSSCKHFALKSGKSRNPPVTVPARAAKASDEAGGYRITLQVDRDHWNARRCAGCRLDSGRGCRNDGVGSIVDQVRRECRQARNVPIGKTDDYLEARVALVVRATQALADCRNAHIHNRRFPRMQQSDFATFRRLLRARRERPRSRRAAEERDELAPLHSITSSAPASTACGNSTPSALAVLRLITSSNLVG